MIELIETFMNYLSVERGLSGNTISAYRRDLGFYADFLRQRDVPALSAVTKNEITDFMFAQKDKGISARSIGRRLAAIRMFHRFLARERIARLDTSNLIETP